MTPSIKAIAADIRRTGAIVSAYTGIALDGVEYPSNYADMLKYIDTLPGFEGAAWTAWPACRQASEADFREVLAKAGEPVEPWLKNALPTGNSVLALFERIKAAIDPTPCPQCHEAGEHKPGCERGTEP